VLKINYKKSFSRRKWSFLQKKKKDMIQWFFEANGNDLVKSKDFHKKTDLAIFRDGLFLA
jgi:hypothetical protein